MANVCKNVRAGGGDAWSIGGTLNIAEGATLNVASGATVTGLLNGANKVAKQTAVAADADAATIATALNALIAAMKTSGIMKST